MSNPFTIVIQLLVRALLYLLLTETHLCHTGKNSAIQMAFYTVSYERSNNTHDQPCILNKISLCGTLFLRAGVHLISMDFGRSVNV